MTTIEDLYGHALPEQPAISPDGSEVVYVLRTTDRKNDRDERALWRVSPGGEARQLTRGRSDNAPAWSPDGTRIAFLRAQDGPAQVWLLPAGGGEPEQVTDLPRGAGAPVWSEDGTKLAFTAPADIADAQAPIVAGRLDYKADGPGYLRSLRSHVHVLDLGTREVRQITDGDWHARSLAWSPDGTKLAFTAGREDDADLTFRAAVHVADVDGGSEPEVAGLADGQAGTVTWAPDGLLVVGRTTATSGHLSLLHLSTGGEVRDLSAPLDRNVMPGMAGYPGGLPVLTGDSVVFCARDRGCTQLYSVDLGGGEPRLVLGGDSQVVTGLSVAGDTAAVVLSTPTSYGEVATVDLTTGEVTVHTGHNEVEPFVREEREFTISDGTVVHGWLVRDPARTGPSPLLVDIHGGPHNAWNGTADPVHLYHQVLAQQGWAVLLVNPRGSDGYGEAFYTAALGAWGKADAKDFLEPIDQLVAEGLADPAKLAVTGYSYGGYMTCYLTSRDTRFAAAVAGGVVGDLTSLGGTSDGGHYMTELELGGQGEHLAELSPLTHVADVRTPTLIYQGARDERCPVGQAEQWFTALRQNGVPAKLVLYPDESHLFILNGKPSHREDFNRRVVDWVREHAEGRKTLDQKHWQRRLSAIAKKHGVPGAALGVLYKGETLLAHHGVLNLSTGVEVTDDTIFQIGSMGKVFTTTVVMRLVDEGLLDLDAPIVDVLPELKLSDPVVEQKVTMRHLLTHTSGIDGDNFTDTGRGDDCLERYTELLADAAQNHPLGATFSYSNAGFVLAGRVIEKLTGKTWDVAMREKLFAPLGLTRTGTLPEEALLHRAAVGHVTKDEKLEPAPVWMLPRSVGPAGTIFGSTEDVLRFAAMHLNGGKAQDGTQVLSEASAAVMTEKQTDVPDPEALGDSWGIGWIRFGWDGQRLVGHDGNTIGQSAFLRILPEHDLAVTLLTNGDTAREVYLELYKEIFAELADLDMPMPRVPAAEPPAVDNALYLGRYERASMILDIVEGENGLQLDVTPTGPMADMFPKPPAVDLVPAGDGRFLYLWPDSRSWSSLVFYSLPTGEQYVHMGVRATPKVS
ncbi:LpqB family beta-propeller domain-containing protein [Lentzea sp. BCCO 10_0798]|uniref:LpqB family beta-propeller domain-containing protein n=1 Tax=Lentzea kristufekii TaxID=3095430 RepID=A0ABU4TNW0_9PSEU|nr:LpqB family beta-propeller domain-containing protein [Lentzea sp. BCCO 10_0798]MDX8049907.1 LpqB family beta-propeller domain-containing protein [Lentzea sp. BCCO 10_0798]